MPCVQVSTNRSADVLEHAQHGGQERSVVAALRDDHRHRGTVGNDGARWEKHDLGSTATRTGDHRDARRAQRRRRGEARRRRFVGAWLVVDATVERERVAVGELKLHPREAQARGLADGALCRAFNDRGECWLTTEVTEDVPPGVAVAESVWWPKRHAGGKGINQLTSAELTDLGGCARFHDGLVQVERAPGDPS